MVRGTENEGERLPALNERDFKLALSDFETSLTVMEAEEPKETSSSSP